MDFIEQQAAEKRKRTEEEIRMVELMKRDWFHLFFGSDLGKQVLGDMLKLANYFGEPPSTSRNDVNFWLGTRRFLNFIVDLSGLDDVQQLISVNQIMAVADAKRMHELNKQADA